LGIIWIVTASAIAAPPPAEPATTDPAKEAKSGTESGKESDTAQQEFDRTFAQWKAALKDVRSIQIKYQGATERERDQLRSEFQEGLASARSLIPKLQAAAEKAYEADPEKNRDVPRFLTSLIIERLSNYQFDEVLRLVRLLQEHGEKDPK